MNKIITSLTNPLVKKVVALGSGKGRTEHGEFVAEGERVITTFLQAGYKPTQFFISDIPLPGLIIFYKEGGVNEWIRHPYPDRSVWLRSQQVERSGVSKANVL